MCVLFFFFQAEDGIRDLTVTGVQTCALPILVPQQPVQLAGELRIQPGLVVLGGELVQRADQRLGQEPAAVRAEMPALVGAVPRSEERRVGKECRSRWSPYH